MLLRGSVTTEAISQRIENRKIAALPPVARNDNKRIATQSLKGAGTEGSSMNKAVAKHQGQVFAMTNYFWRSL